MNKGWAHGLRGATGGYWHPLFRGTRSGQDRGRGHDLSILLTLVFFVPVCPSLAYLGSGAPTTSVSIYVCLFVLNFSEDWGKWSNFDIEASRCCNVFAPISK